MPENLEFLLGRVSVGSGNMVSRNKTQMAFLIRCDVPDPIYQFAATSFPVKFLEIINGTKLIQAKSVRFEDKADLKLW